MRMWIAPILVIVDVVSLYSSIFDIEQFLT